MQPPVLAMTLLAGGLAAGIAVATLGIAQDARAQQAPALDPQAIIVGRQAAYALMGADIGLIKAGLQSGASVKEFADPAKAMAFWGTAIPGMFPAGTESGHDTKALPAIWSDRAGFEKSAADFTAAATKLAQLAEAGDKAGFTSQFQDTAKACGACHRTYRAK